ncbi:MAG: multidrug effflux MFS transporter [Prevotellaceae bacterium]|nr:multidrug effflux MFS transporter [Prevotellaceae bacterium]
MRKRTLLLILGNLTAFGPFVTDFYLACLPRMTLYFAASPSVIQTSLTAGMWGLAAGQLFVGPVSDKFGRKWPLIACLVLFVLSTAGCMLSNDIRPFIFFRLLQGLTGAGGLVISKAILADKFTAAELARCFALLAAVQGAAPIAAPLLGGLAFSLTSWQGTFAVLGIWGVLLTWMCLHLQESLRKEQRLTMPVWKSFASYLPVLRNARYMTANLLQGFAGAALMAYVSASPFIFQQHFSLTPLQYSGCFACNALGLVLGSAVVMRSTDLHRAMAVGTFGLLAAGVLMSTALLAGWPFLLFEVPVFCLLFCVGILTPVTMTLAVNVVHEHKGVASALLGATPYILGGVVAPLTGMGDMVHPLVALILLTVVAGALLWAVSRRLERR